MSIPEGFRFYSPDDALAERARWALTRIFKLAEVAADALLEDPARRMLMRVADDGTLAGFIVFKDYKSVLLSPDNAFIARDDKDLLATPGLKVYSFEQVWYRDNDFDMARILREVLPAMSTILDGEAVRYALLCLLPDGPSSQALADLLLEQGFHINPNVYCDYRFSLGQVPQVADDVPEAPVGVDLRSFAHPPDMTALVTTFNRVFAGGAEALEPAHVQAMLELPSFARDLSFWVAREGRVAGFVWMFWQAPGVAKLNLVATDPDFRGQGLVLSCTPVFMRACQRAGVHSLSFTIQSENREPQKIARSLGAVLTQRRQTYIRAR
ncbi:MAG: GNAT family N-acetyltransferase [Pseudomonadota bacterium]